MDIKIQEAVDVVLRKLNPQQQQVLLGRYGLDGRHPRRLQEIGTQFSITRERVRQIQNAGIKALAEDRCMQELAEAIEELEEALELCGGIASDDRICILCNAATKAERGYVMLLLDVGRQFFHAKRDESTASFWSLGEERARALKESMGTFHEKLEEKKGELFSHEGVKDLFSSSVDKTKKKLLPKVDEALHISKKVDENPLGEWGHADHPEIALSNLGGYIRLVLKRAERPMHFSEIAKEVSKLKGKEVHKGTCHNELVNRPEFVLVGRGMYTLSGDGVVPGTVADVIERALTQKGPLTKERIIEEVLKERVVKEQTVVQALSNKERFIKKADGKYQSTV